MRTPALFTAASLCLAQIASPLWAGTRKHHPWLSHHTSHVKHTRVIAQRLPPIPHDEVIRFAEDHSSGHKKGQKIVQQALRYEGTRYQMGGTTKKGLDCSGLISRVWSDLKLKKVPVSSALYQSGEPVRMTDLRPGDLVFFKNTYKHGISHVGVYTGNNKFVHAANHRKGVTITQLSDPYYQVHYAGARRLY